MNNTDNASLLAENKILQARVSELESLIKKHEKNREHMSQQAANWEHAYDKQRDRAKKAEACCAEMRDTFTHLQEYWNGNSNDRAMSDALEEVLYCCKAILDKHDCGKGWLSPEKKRLLVDALEYAGSHEHTKSPCEYCHRIDSALAAVKKGL